MTRFRPAVIAALFLFGCSDHSELPLDPSAEPSLARGGGAVVRVTSSLDDGPGSFRSAVEQANAKPSIRIIEFKPGLSIGLLSPVRFEGPQDLRIAGNGATVDGAALASQEPNFIADGGGDLDIERITFRGAPGHGLVVQLPATATGTSRIVLRGVTAEDNLGHGVEINDQEDPEDAGDPDAGIRGNSNGSAASLEVVVINSLFRANGFGALDRDGLRVNEGGPGNLRVSILASRALDNGADGVELDERGAGNLDFEIVGSHFTRNGDFDQSDEPDKDDGFDADEGDDGDLVALVTLSTSNDNFEEGFDFNENDAGDMRVRMTGVEASGNPEEGIDLEEDDDWQGGGDLVASLTLVRADRNGVEGDGGVKIRERGEGDLAAELRQVRASRNESAGIHVREQGNGSLRATVQHATTGENGAEGIFLREDDLGSQSSRIAHTRADGNGSHGIDFDENDAGDLAALVEHTTATGNGEEGVRADEGGDGTGTLRLKRVSLAGNAADGTAGNVDPGL